MNQQFNAVISAQTELSLNLLSGLLNENPQNSIILSPSSVAIALSMIFIGAKNATSNELTKLLSVDDKNKEQIEKYYSQLSKFYQTTEGKSYILETANQIYIKKNFSIQDSFIKAIEKNYGGGFESVDFSQNVATAKKKLMILWKKKLIKKLLI